MKELWKNNVTTDRKIESYTWAGLKYIQFLVDLPKIKEGSTIGVQAVWTAMDGKEFDLCIYPSHANKKILFPSVFLSDKLAGKGETHVTPIVFTKVECDMEETKDYYLMVYERNTLKNKVKGSEIIGLELFIDKNK